MLKIQNNTLQDGEKLDNLPTDTNSILANKQDKETGKGLSTNDFTNIYKTKLDGLSNYSLPTASTSVLGGVKVDGTTITIIDGVISSSGGGGGGIGIAGELTTGTITATGGQTVVTVGTYILGNNRLSIELNGLGQIIGVDYTETSTTSITFTSGLTAGDVVKYRILS